MPTKHAAFKAWRQTKKRMATNAKVKADVDFLLRQSRKLLDAKKIKEAAPLVLKSVTALDKAAQHGVMKKNTVSRLKSRLAARMNLATQSK